MSTQDSFTPENQLAENELICEKLLGWERRKCFSQYDGRFMGYDFLDGKRETTAPSFTTWADAGLILEALKARGMDRLELSVDDEGDWKCVVEWDRHQMHRSRYSGESAPLAVRKVVLSYIEAARL